MKLHILRWKIFLPLQKVFTPLLTSWKSEKLKNLKIRFVASNAQKGGKKLSEGVKNFFMIKSNVSAFSWTKNHTFIWQTHSYSSDQTTAAKSHLGGAIWGISFKRFFRYTEVGIFQNSGLSKSAHFRKYLILFYFYHF